MLLKSNRSKSIFLNSEGKELDLNSAYKKAIQFAKSHYENFPVVSFLLPSKLKNDVAIIYWFARTADDLADENIFSEEERLNKLNLFEERLQKLLKSNFENEFELALFSTIIHRKLSIQYFFDLLSAFKQDVIKKNYETFDELLDYCNRSANPIGRLILELLEIRAQKAYELSDKICTALQLTNFYQDVLIDFEKRRIYIPQQELKNYGVDEKYFQEKIFDENIKNLIKFQIDRTENLFNEGKELLNYLQGRMKYEIDWTINGGLFILEKIKLNNYNIFEPRPEINKKEFIKLLFKSRKDGRRFNKRNIEKK